MDNSELVAKQVDEFIFIQKPKKKCTLLKPFNNILLFINILTSEHLLVFDGVCV
jgi:hypothetical protein